MARPRLFGSSVRAWKIEDGLANISLREDEQKGVEV